MEPSIRLPRSAPSAMGVAPAALEAFLDGIGAAQIALHSVMLVRHGHVVAEGWWKPYAPELPHVLFSLSKSFTSSAVGLAVGEGLLTVDDRVVDFFPEEVAALPPEQVNGHLAAMRVRDLLTMTTGHDEDSTPHLHERENWAQGFLALPVAHEPGTHFVYNSGATYMCSAIVQKLTGQTVLDYLTPRLMEPLGITGAWWESCPRGINVGGWGLNVRTEDIACFGQLYLQRGEWNGQQLIDPNWVAQATARQVPNGTDPDSDWNQGYGYQFWRCRHNAYRGDGAFGQYCVVMPDQDAVLAITGGLDDMQAVLDLVWDHLLPGMADDALPADAQAERKLAARLRELAFVPPAYKGSPVAGQVSGTRYLFPENEAEVKAVQANFEADGRAELVIEHGRFKSRLRIGAGEWQKGQTSFAPDARVHEQRPVVAGGTWTADDTYMVRLLFYTTPFEPTLTLRFAGDQLFVDYRANVGFGPLAQPQLVGTAS